MRRRSSRSWVMKSKKGSSCLAWLPLRIQDTEQSIIFVELTGFLGVFLAMSVTVGTHVNIVEAP